MIYPSQGMFLNLELFFRVSHLHSAPKETNEDHFLILDFYKLMKILMRVFQFKTRHKLEHILVIRNFLY